MFKKFTKKEVEQLIEGVRDAYASKIKRLNYRVDGLVAENRSLRATIAELRAREQKVGKAIVDAESKGDEIKEFYRMSAQMELQTFRLFAEKWRALAEQMAGKLPGGESKEYVQFAHNLAAILGKQPDFFTSEEKKQEDDPKAAIERYVQEEEEYTFNLDDVLNPKGKLDLGELCRNLGLMDDEKEEEED